jgi:ubiquinone/menaquinone biosynthesis C-methylase UbiE
MNREFWEKYAEEADSHYNEEFAKYIRDLTTSLRCTSVLEVGCNAGNDLKLFPDTVEVHGIDSNEKIIEMVKARLPSGNFKVGTVTEMPYENSSIDMVFSHGFFNYLEDELVAKGLDEIFRVAKKYFVTCEVFGNNNIIDEANSRKGRNMFQRLSEYKVKIISNVEMHEDIDPEQPKFVLVRKL